MDSETFARVTDRPGRPCERTPTLRHATAQLTGRLASQLQSRRSYSTVLTDGTRRYDLLGSRGREAHCKNNNYDSTKFRLFPLSI